MGPEGEITIGTVISGLKTPDPAAGGSVTKNTGGHVTPAGTTVDTVHTPLFSTAYHGNEGRETEGEQV